MIRCALALCALLLLACSPAPAPAEPAPSAAVQARMRTAVFAGGCFWSTEKAFEQAPGVISAVSGFAGGTVVRPTYEQVVRGGTGHLEAVQVTYDPAVTTYRALVDRFWRTIDPTDAGGQFCDRGPSYATAVFAAGDQMAAARASRAAAARALGRNVVTPVRAAARFWPAGAEHQDFAERNPGRYAAYRIGCRRAERLRAVWGEAAIG